MKSVPYLVRLPPPAPRLYSEVELLLNKRSEGGDPTIIRRRADWPFQQEKGDSHRPQPSPGKVQDGRRWLDVGECECECVEVQGAPEGRAPREITFRSLLTKDTHAEPNDLQCNPSSDSSAQKSSGKALGRH